MFKYPASKLTTSTSLEKNTIRELTITEIKNVAGGWGITYVHGKGLTFFLGNRPGRG